MTEAIPGPRIDRRIEMHFVGDWGWANLHKVCGWLGAGMIERSAPGSRYAIWNTPYAAAETVRLIGDGQYDLAFTTPAQMLRNAVDGVGLFAAKRYPDLMSLGTFPQTDTLVLAIDASLGIRTFEDIRQKKPRLHIATQPNDGTSYIGFVVDSLLAEAGVPREKILEWGGSFVERDPPDQCAQAVRDGTANALFYEAIMTPYWRFLARDKPLNFIPFEREVLDVVRKTYGWQTNVLPAGALTGLEHDLEAIDWSDWAAIVRPDFPDDVAYTLAWVATNTQEVIERQYRHLAPNISPLTYPVVPAKVAKTTVPLHPGAARYYREAGLLL
jgi:TRAP-type uncharacterized transport system substrate-binding protein